MLQLRYRARIVCLSLFTIGIVFFGAAMSTQAAEDTVKSAPGEVAISNSDFEIAEAQFSSICSQAGKICKNGRLVSNPTNCIPDCNHERVCFSTLSDEPSVRSCLQRYNDLIWVNDQEADGHSGIAAVVNDSHADRICRNPHGAGTWARCNWDWPEGLRWAWQQTEFDKETDNFFSWEVRFFED